MQEASEWLQGQVDGPAWCYTVCLSDQHLDCYRTQPFMLHHVHPQRYPLTHLLDEDEPNSFANHLEMQFEIMQEVARATQEICVFNRAAGLMMQKPKWVMLSILRTEQLTITAKWSSPT